MQSLTNPQAGAVAETFFADPHIRPHAVNAAVGPAAGRARSLKERWVEAASRLGFVLSFVFLLIVGLYGLSLSGRLGVQANTLPEFLDRVVAAVGFGVREVTIEGLENMPEAEVHAALSEMGNRSIAFFDTAAARDRILEIGWVEKAQVRRTLPGRLHISIVERRPYARWRGEDGSVSLVGEGGRILGAAPAGRHQNLPLLSGEGAAEDAHLIVPHLQARAALANRIEFVELVAGRYWALHMDGAPLIKIARSPEARVLDRLESLLASRELNGRHVSVLDFRLPNRIVVELKDKSVASREKLVALLTRADEPVKARAKQRKSL